MPIADLFNQTHLLPTIPQVVHELIASLGKDDTDMRSLSKKVALDQVLAARVIRLANSARYGLARQVASIEDATVVLGFNSLRTLVVAAGVTGSMTAGDPAQRRQFWASSLLVAGYARHLAPAARINPEVAFTSGMMLHLGQLLLMIVRPALAEQVEAAVQHGEDRLLAEDRLLGFDHYLISAELLRRWNFPDPICAAYLRVRAPLAQAEPNPLASILHLAQVLASQALADGGAAPPTLPPKLPEDLLAQHGWSAEHLLARLPEAEQLTAGLEQLLG